MFNVYVQPYGYDRPSIPPFSFAFLLMPSQLALFFFTISALSRRPRCITGIRPLGYLLS